jgi:hypothetical protein
MTRQPVFLAGAAAAGGAAACAKTSEPSIKPVTITGTPRRPVPRSQLRSPIVVTPLFSRALASTVRNGGLIVLGCLRHFRAISNCAGLPAR